MHDERQGPHVSGRAIDRDEPGDGSAVTEPKEMLPERPPPSKGGTHEDASADDLGERMPMVAVGSGGDPGQTDRAATAGDPSVATTRQPQASQSAEDPRDRRARYRPPLTRLGATERRHLYNRLTEVGLTLGFLATILTVVVFLDARGDGTPAPPERCLSRWNSETNGVARRQLNRDGAALTGTRLARMWIGVLRGSCTLTYLLPDGKGVIWRETGPDWNRQLVGPLSGLHSSAARASTEPNVKAVLVPGSNIRLHPRMGTVRPE